MNIGSPDFIQKQLLGEYLVNRKQELFNLYDAKKNSMWVLWDSIQEFLRSQEEAGQGFAQWEYGYLLGSGSAKGLLSPVWQGETRITGMAIGESFLYQAVSFFYRQEMSEDEHPRCCERNKTGLAYRERIGQAVHGRTIKESEKDQAWGNWYRRDSHQERACLSDSGKRFRKGFVDMVWWEGSLGRES